MEVIFRVDATARIGHGHLSRCLALADALMEMGLTSTFVMGDRSQRASSRVEAAGHGVVVLPPVGHSEGKRDRWLKGSWEDDARRTVECVHRKEVRCVIVDQYGLDIRWERFVGRRLKVPVVVVDGVADRAHHCELLVDPTYHPESGERRWRSLVPAHTKLFVGPRYAMLRPEFSEALGLRKDRGGAVEELLVAFGGSDPVGATELSVDAVRPLSRRGVHTTVVAGASKPGMDRLRNICARREDITLYVDTDEMAGLMAGADLAIGGAGTMTWERAFLGLPAIVVAIADHQVDVAAPVAEFGAIRFVGKIEDIDQTRLHDEIEALMDEPAELRAMARRSRRLMGKMDEVGTVDVACGVREVIERFSRGKIWSHSPDSDDRR